MVWDIQTQFSSIEYSSHSCLFESHGFAKDVPKIDLFRRGCPGWKAALEANFCSSGNFLRLTMKTPKKPEQYAKRPSSSWKYNIDTLIMMVRNMYLFSYGYLGYLSPICRGIASMVVLELEKFG